MSIKIQTHKNIVFFQLLLALIHDGEGQLHYPLADKIVERFEFIKELPAYKEFVEIFSQKNIPQNQWDYLLFALYTTDKFTPSEAHIQDEYISGIYEIYKSEIYPQIRKIYLDSEFNDIYLEEFKPLYDSICTDIQAEVDKSHPEKVLLKFWRLDSKTDLYLVPNLFRVGGGSGFPINGEFYAVIGASNCNGEILFKPTNMISSIYHEFSHSFFKECISQDMTLKMKNQAICKSLKEIILEKVPNGTETIQNYGTSTTYFEETFIRAIQIFLSYEFFKQIYANSDSLKMDSQKKLDAREAEGFVFVKNFFSDMQENPDEDPMTLYFDTLESLTKKENE